MYRDVQKLCVRLSVLTVASLSVANVARGAPATLVLSSKRKFRDSSSRNWHLSRITFGLNAFKGNPQKMMKRNASSSNTFPASLRMKRNNTLHENTSRNSVSIEAICRFFFFTFDGKFSHLFQQLLSVPELWRMSSRLIAFLERRPCVAYGNARQLDTVLAERLWSRGVALVASQR